MTTHPDGLKAPRHAGTYAGTTDERVAALEGAVKLLGRQIKVLEKGLMNLAASQIRNEQASAKSIEMAGQPGAYSYERTGFLAVEYSSVKPMTAMDFAMHNDAPMLVLIEDNRIGKSDISRIIRQLDQPKKKRPSKRWEHTGKDWE